MSWRTVVISKPAKLKVKNFQLNILFLGDTSVPNAPTKPTEISLPLEDIAIVILETPIITLTSALLSAFAEYNISLITCDKSHMPSYYSQAFCTNSRQVQIQNIQLNLSLPFKKKAWQKIVTQKVLNQAICLELLNIGNPKQIKQLAKSIDSGDSKNIESIAANQYFDMIFGNDFKRRDANTINMALNYGYAIIRSIVARSLCMYGFLLSQGIHHHSELNPYNLVDDFMEPYRPFVDYFIYNLLSNIEDDNNEGLILSNNIRKKILEIVEYSILIDNKKQSLRFSTEIMIASYQTACKTGELKLLKTPILTEPKLHSYE